MLFCVFFFEKFLTTKMLKTYTAFLVHLSFRDEKFTGKVCNNFDRLISNNRGPRVLGRNKRSLA